MASMNGTATRNGHATTSTDANYRAQLVRRLPHANLARHRQRVDFDEIGTTGLREYGGFVLEEWLAQLQGPRRAWVYREMMDNDPVVGGILFAIRMMARRCEWRVEEGNDSRATEFVESCMQDMSQTWGDFISEALSFLGYGWSLHETVYKRRQGSQPEPDWQVDQDGIDETDTPSSKFSDGLIGWRKMPVRAQETLLRWHFDTKYGVRAMEQIDWAGHHNVIPIQKAVLFRTEATRGNPEGKSILRNAYTAWYYRKRIQQIEAIGVERDLAGLPTITPPDGVDIMSAANSELLSQVQEIVQSIRRDEDEGVVLPSGGWKLELLSSGGARQIDTDPIVRRYRQEIASSVLADFILVGLDAIGSYAMVDVKSDLFGLVLDAVLDLICEPLNRYAIPRLLRVNGMSVDEPPQIAHGSTGRIDLEKVGNFLYQLSTAGAPIPWTEDLIESLFSEAGLPVSYDEPQPAQPHTETEPEPSPAPPPTPPEPQAEPKPTPGPVTKADRTPTRQGLVVHVAPHLRQRADVLSNQLEREINSALAELGEHAATGYLAHVAKAGASPSATAKYARSLTARVLKHLDLKGWLQRTLLPLLRNHAGRTVADTQRTLQAEIGLELQVADKDAQQIAQRAGTGLGMRDIEPQLRAAIMQAIQEGLAAGDGPARTAQRIRDQVPAGRFVNAGAKYRSRLIARTETAHMQRQAVLAAYRSNPRVAAVRLSDGVYGPPRSDSECMERDGNVVPIDQADQVHAYHPQCTLSFEPVIAGSVQAPAPTAEPVAA